ncbi:unnamed protein product [Linum tenue]|uniref:Cytochrome b561 domain-containing protein n=1 Tax=Linum tenue TaxID=586396 RepID=A0AAV0NJY4_9ROSI|nr:unnamed protein product [Linum tenue]
MAPPQSFSLPLLLFGRILALTVAALLLYWAFVVYSRHSSEHSLIYAARHPLLMVIGFILVSGEAILVHRWLPCSRNGKKLAHLGLQGVALSCGVFGVWTIFHVRKGIMGNFLSLHSWLGLICISLFAAQVFISSPHSLYLLFNCSLLVLSWLMGFLSFWYRGEMRTVRASRLPWHIFLGLYTYTLAVATAETGLMEKLTFREMRRLSDSTASKRSPETMVANGLGLGLALLAGVVILAAISPKHQTTLQRKSVYSESNSKC